MEIVSNTSSPCYCQDSGTQATVSASATKMAAISQSQSLDMELTTDEGDTVSLSYDAYAAAFYGAYGQMDADQDSLEMQWGSISAGLYEQELSISIEGDLNAQERKDVRKAIRTIGRMMHSFIKGNAEQMEAKALKLTGLETVESLDVSMAYERQVVTAAQAETTLTYNDNGDTVDQPAQAVAYDQNSGSVDHISQPVVFSETSTGTDAETLTKDMADVLKAVQAPMDYMRQMAQNMLTHFRSRFDSENALVHELFDYIQERLDELLSDEDASQAF